MADTGAPELSKLDFPEGYIPPPLRPFPEGEPLLQQTGSCFCKKYTFQLEHPSLKAVKPVECNCTYCQIRCCYGIYVPKATFKLEPDNRDALIKYSHSKVPDVTHFLCDGCGNEIFWYFDGFLPGSGKMGVNAKLITGVDILSMETEKVDGLSI